MHGISFFEGKVCDKAIDHLLQLFCLKQISTSLPLIALQVNECLLKKRVIKDINSSLLPIVHLPPPCFTERSLLRSLRLIREFAVALICMRGLWAKEVWFCGCNA